MIDLTKITPEQANKIECALLQLESYVIETMQSWQQLSADREFEKIGASNAQWWREVHELIYGKQNQ